MSVHEKSGAGSMTPKVSAEVKVERGRLSIALLGIVATIGLTVGIGFDDTWWVGLFAGVGSAAFACLLINWPWTRQGLITFERWLSGW
jgi:hypothetical protein